MKRTLLFKNEDFANKEIRITLVDGFRNIIKLIGVYLFDNNGEYYLEIELLNKNNNDFYLATTPNNEMVTFYFYDNDGDLNSDEALKRQEFTSFNRFENDEIDLINFNCLLNRYVYGEAITSNEEMRMLCEYFNFANNNKTHDVRFCYLDKELLDG
jgi:hypothetical protein